MLEEVVKEEEYQRIKRLMCKQSDYFTVHEIINFNAIFNATPEKNYKKRRENIKS